MTWRCEDKGNDWKKHDRKVPFEGVKDLNTMYLMGKILLVESNYEERFLRRVSRRLVSLRKRICFRKIT